MFKVIHNDRVIDILDRVIYVRCLQSGKFVNTDITSAHGFYGSNGKSVYILEGINCPQGISLPQARLESISKSEYDNLQKKLEHSSVDNNSVLEISRLQKLQELSNDCKNSIVSGVGVLFSDGKVHNFRLTIEDQLNLESIRAQLVGGARKILYHETDSVVRWFSADDMQRLLVAMDQHRTRHTTYYNLLKHCIHNMYNKDEIERIYYGIPLESLPVELDLNVKEYNIGK